jgi:hypothetical protein
VHICDVGLALVVVREQPGRLCQRVSRIDVIDVSDLSPPHAWVKDWLDHTGPDPEFRIRVSDLYCSPSCASARFFSTSDKPAPALPLSAAGALAAHQRHELLALNPGAERQIKRSGAAAPPLPGRLVATEVVVLSPSRDLRVTVLRADLWRRRASDRQHRGEQRKAQRESCFSPRSFRSLSHPRAG